MSNVKVCPLIHAPCLENGCEWWDPDWKNCSMNVMVKYLRAQDVRATFEHNIPAEFLDGIRK
ncbi:MAG TPA: hypothetical protein O0X66_03140 [Methanocorpusculum sp.]|nr:hypothetical protein [Methanocorpusculum sp.]HJJ53478.1 hypothetical protein [Methanocorpusculum sp.]